MFFEDRTWQVHEIATPEELAHKLTQQTWCLCCGFVVSGHPDYLFLNDSTSADGAAEFAVVKGGLDARDRYQVDSITFSWCNTEKALSFIRRSLAGEFDHTDWPVTVRVETPDEHGVCGSCA